MTANSGDMTLEVKGGIATLTLNRPDKLNAMTTAMWRELPQMVRRVQGDDEARVLVLTGAGRGFCAGSDVGDRLVKRLEGAEPMERTRQELIEPVGAVALAVADLDKPAIAAVNGVAAGAGLSISLLCDLRIASEQARFGAIWVRRGLIPDLGCTWSLPRVVGTEWAIMMMATGDLIDAQEALRIGLVSRVVPHQELMQAAYELAGRIAAGPAVAIELAKRGVYRSLQNDLRAQLDYESYAQNLCRQTEDHREAVAAFVEKREAKFRGK